MAEIAKSYIKLMKSQRLDDTDYGGGQMTSEEVIAGNINELFPDISRFDRTYGRVSLRKAYLSIGTEDRATYYGSHTVITEQALDPLVGITFFSSEDWYDVRSDAQNRIEAYLVKGPVFGGSLWGNHYLGTKTLKLHAPVTWDVPLIGDTMVLQTTKDFNGLSISQLEQFIRVVDVDSKIQLFTRLSGTSTVEYEKKIITITIGNSLENDFPGSEVEETTDYADVVTQIYTTTAADASRYYGVSTLKADATAGQFYIQAESIYTSLVPSAQSETALVDEDAGSSVVVPVQPGDGIVSKIISATFIVNAVIYIGEGIIPGTFSFTSASFILSDNGKGDILQNLVVVGSLDYASGRLVIGTTISNSGAHSGTCVYQPAATPTQVSRTGQIQISINNRGFVYTFKCTPIPQSGTLQVDFMAGGKWYSLTDQGGGELKGSDTAIGSGSLDLSTGSLSLSLGSMPDVDSSILFFWGEETTYVDMASDDPIPFSYLKTLQNAGVTRGSFTMSWTQNSILHTISEDSDGILDYTPFGGSKIENVGIIRYVTGEIEIISLPITPPASTLFDFLYTYGTPTIETFDSPAREVDGTIILDLSNSASIIPGTLEIEWKSDIEIMGDGPTRNVVKSSSSGSTYSSSVSGIVSSVGALRLSSV